MNCGTRNVIENLVSHGRSYHSKLIYSANKTSTYFLVLQKRSNKHSLTLSHIRIDRNGDLYKGLIECEILAPNTQIQIYLAKLIASV